MSRPILGEIMRRASQEPHFGELLRKCPAASDRGQLEALGIAADRARSWTACDGLV